MSDSDQESSDSSEVHSSRSRSPPSPVNSPPVHSLAQLSLSDISKVDIDSCTDLPILLTILATESREKAFKAVLRVRKLLSVEGSPPVQEVLDAGGVDVLHKAMKHECPKIRFEATWAMTNLLSGSTQQVSEILRCDIIPTLLGLFSPEESWEIKEQAIWAIGNLAGDCTEYRNRLLDAGALRVILSNLREDSLSYMRNTSWVVSNLTRGKPPPSEMYLREAAPFVISRIKQGDDEAATDLMWSLSYITEVVIDDNYMTRERLRDVMGFLEHATVSLAIPALRVIGNIISSTDQYTNFLIEAGLLTHLKQTITHPKRAMRRETAWLLSNICAEGPSTLSLVFPSTIIPDLVNVALTDEEPVRKEAVWALANACESSDYQQKVTLLVSRVGEVLQFGLNTEEKTLIAVCLDGYRSLFAGFQEANQGETLRQLINVDIVAEAVKKLAKKGGSKAKDLLRRMAWMNLNDNDLGEV